MLFGALVDFVIFVFCFSVERLYNQLWKSGQPALEPLTICATGGIVLLASLLKSWL